MSGSRAALSVGFCLLFTLAADADSTPAPSPPPSPTPTAATHGGTSALVVDERGAATLLGMPVQTAKGEDMGRVVDVVVDRNGNLLAAIVDFGGFLGVGTRKIAVDWGILHFPKTGGLTKLITDLPRDRLRAAPAYQAGEPIVIMGATPAPTPSPSVAPTPSPTPVKKP